MIDPERCFRMSAVNALDRLQAFVSGRPSLELERAASVLRAGPISASGFDYEQAVSMVRHDARFLVLEKAPRVERLRLILTAMVLQIEPSWQCIIPLGRSRLAQNLEPDTKQIFDAAGLYGAADDPSIRAWWDRMAQIARGKESESLVDIGRRGEDLTMEHEAKLLAAAGRGDLKPMHVGFDDNTLGYDVRSYWVAGGGIRPKYIEVKSTEVRPLHFYLSRKAWTIAEKLRDEYTIQLWHLPTRQLTEISFAELSPHIPSDHGLGRWEKILVTLA